MVSRYTRIIINYKGLLQLYNVILLYTCYEAQHSFESAVSWVLAVKPAQRILLPLSIRWALYPICTSPLELIQHSYRSGYEIHCDAKHQSYPF